MIRRQFRHTAALALMLGCALVSRASADDPASPDDESGESVHYGAIALESAIVFAIPTAYYWNTAEHQAVDWTLDWDWESWKAKLFSTEKLKFDTNPFHVNALRHPLVGVLNYQLARSNGVGAINSMWFAYVTGVAWEFLIEFREAPSINDMLANGAGGISIGEPLYQLGQLWRSDKPSFGDRLHTALFSPWDMVHDTYRRYHKRARPRPWRSLELGVGSTVRWHDGDPEAELALVADFDIINHAAFTKPGAHAGPIATGAWSRIQAGLQVGDYGNGSQLTRTFLHTRTSYVGSYQQSANGTGELAAIGTAFTYRFDRFRDNRDRLAILHLAGPQLQLTVRRPDAALWIDVAGYGDVAFVNALVFGTENPFPRPPPYFTSLQADLYYYAVGFSASARLRGAAGPWRLDLELGAHQFWQIESHTIHNTELEPPAEPFTATGLSDTRLFSRIKLGYRPGRWGVAVTSDGAYRRGDWESQDRTLDDVSVGVLLELDY